MKTPLLSRIKDSIKVLLGNMRAIPIDLVDSEHPRTFNCPVCQSTVKAFHALSHKYFDKLDKHGYIHSIFLAETINRQAYSCPNCGASDRDRIYALYMQRKGCLFTTHNHILDIAPSKALSQYIRLSFPDIRYHTADLFAEDVDDKIDITDMSIYTDGKYDFFICSHVLEHVQEDEKAISELYRVLADSGQGIVMVPINLGLTKDYEKPEITTPEGRWKHFGQDDHVRIYSKTGFTGKLKSAGFFVHEYDIEFFGRSMFDRNGIHPRSVLYVVTKR